jgi:pimeloyl-ACP methyl ester carboxylesterase
MSIRNYLVPPILAFAIVHLTSSVAAEPAAGPPAPTAKPTIVLVHGAFADGASWNKVIPLLQAKGYTVVAVHDPLSSLPDDVAQTTRAIDAQQGDVILVGHSYGGFVITDAGNDPKVKALVYVAAFAPDVNESITDMGKGQPVPPWQPLLKVDSGGYATLPTDAVLKYFAQDLAPAEAKNLAATQGPLSTTILGAKLKSAAPAWKSKPSWYVRAENDLMLDPNAQAAMAKRANATVTSIKSSHVVMLSHPADVAKVILVAAAGANTPKK